MHEISLCESVLQILENNATTQGYRRVRRVWLEIGQLACVNPEALRFSFKAVSNGTLADNAALDIVAVAGRAWCGQCETEVSVSERFDACPHCGGYGLDITDGEQMRIKELEVE